MNRKLIVGSQWIEISVLWLYKSFEKRTKHNITFRGGEISKIYTCPRTTGCKKALVHTKALLARTQINTKARFVNIMI